MHGLGVMVCLAAALAPRSAQAIDLNKKVELSLDGALVNYTTIKSSVTVTDGTFGNTSKRDVSGSSTTFGVLGAGMGVGVGYAVSSSALLGLYSQILTTSVSGEGSSSVSATSVGVLPRVEYLFDGDSARPFLAGMLGVASLSGKGMRTQTQFQFGGSVGVHAFATDSVAIDPMLTILRYSASVNDSDAEASGFRVLVTLGLSAWLGGASNRHTAATAPVEEEAPAEDPAQSDVVEIKLPHHRLLVLKHGKRPELPTVSTTISEPGSDWDLVGCGDIRVTIDGQNHRLKEKSRIETGDRHSVSGRMPVAALQALAAGGTTLDACAKRWPLSLKSRQAIRDYLDERASRVPAGSEGAFTPQPTPAPAPAMPQPETPAAPAAPAPSDAPPAPPATSFPAAPAPAPAPGAPAK